MRSKTTTTTKKQTASVQSPGDSVNQVTLIGRLVAAPELRETASGKHVTTVRVATNGKSHADFHDVVLWSQLADFACQYLGKGRLVYIEGRLQSRPVAGHRWQYSTDRRDRRQPAPGALLEERFGGSSGVTPGLVPEGALAQPSRGSEARSATILLGFGRTGLHGAAQRQGGPSRRFAPVLPEDSVLFP
jgi:single-strand DNA-binding protein